MIKKFLKRDEEGQGLVEYALILVMVAIIVLAILLLLGPQVGGVFSNVVDNFRFIGGGNHGVISGVSAFDIGGSRKVTVTVSQPTRITINVTSGGGSPDAQDCSGSCTFTIPSAAASGSGVAAADAGGQWAFTW